MTYTRCDHHDPAKDAPCQLPAVWCVRDDNPVVLARAEDPRVRYGGQQTSEPANACGGHVESFLDPCLGRHVLDMAPQPPLFLTRHHLGGEPCWHLGQHVVVVLPGNPDVLGIDLGAAVAYCRAPDRRGDHTAPIAAVGVLPAVLREAVRAALAEMGPERAATVKSIALREWLAAEPAAPVIAESAPDFKEQRFSIEATFPGGFDPNLVGEAVRRDAEKLMAARAEAGPESSLFSAGEAVEPPKDE